MVNDQLRNVLIDSQNMENSPLLQHDFDKESEGLPVYHDHLIEEILNQKVKNLREYQAAPVKKYETTADPPNKCLSTNSEWVNRKS